MSEELYLEMPKKKKSFMDRLSVKVRKTILIIFLCICLLIIAHLWIWSGQVKSTQSRLSAMIYTLTPNYSGILSQLIVREGDIVSAGQVIGQLESSSQSSMQNYLHIPKKDEMERRIQQAMEDEKNVMQNLLQARQEEERVRNNREEKIAKHAQAMYAMRSVSLDKKEDYERARAVEIEARMQMERAQEEFERASRIRAAISQEMGRIHEEIQLARQMASRNRNIMNKPIPSSITNSLYAPIGGRILSGLAHVGQSVSPGEVILRILPHGVDEKEGYQVEAWFTEDHEGLLQKGQSCRVHLVEKNINLSGTIKDIGSAISQNDSARVVPVRILLNDQPPVGTPPNITVECIVRTRTFLGFSGF